MPRRVDPLVVVVCPGRAAEETPGDGGGEARVGLVQVGGPRQKVRRAQEGFVLPRRGGVFLEMRRCSLQFFLPLGMSFLSVIFSFHI